MSLNKIKKDMIEGLNEQLDSLVNNRHHDEFVATEGQKVFTLTKSYDQFQNRIDVAVGGIPQFSPNNFIESSPTTFTLSEGVPAGVKVSATYFSETQPLGTDLESVVDSHANILSTNNDLLTTHTNKITNVESHLTDIVLNIKSFGAKCDGVTDDTEPLKKALISLPSTGGSIFLPGITFIASEVSTDKNVTFVGKRANKYTLLGGFKFASRLDGVGIKVNGSYLSLLDISLDTDGSKADGKNFTGIIHAKNGSGGGSFCTIDGVHIKNFSGIGLVVVDGIDSSFKKIRASGNNIGIEVKNGIWGYSTTCYFEENYYTTSNIGLKANKVFRSSLKNCIFEYNQTGAEMKAGEWIVERVYCENNTVKGIDGLDSYAVVTSPYSNGSNDTIDFSQQSVTYGSGKLGSTKTTSTSISTQKMYLYDSWGNPTIEIKSKVATNGNNVGLQFTKDGVTKQFMQEFNGILDGFSLVIKGSDASILRGGLPTGWTLTRTATGIYDLRITTGNILVPFIMGSVYSDGETFYGNTTNNHHLIFQPISLDSGGVANTYNLCFGVRIFAKDKMDVLVDPRYMSLMVRI